MHWMGFVLGLAGILTTAVIGILNSRLTHKARISSQMAKLYEKRLDAYADLMYTFSELTALCTNVYHRQGRDLNGQRLIEFLKDTEKGYIDCNTAYRKWSVFLPLSVNYKAMEFLNAYSIVTKAPGAYEVSATGEHLPERDLEHVLADALYNFANAARNDMGVEGLSRQSQSLIHRITGQAAKPVSRANSNIIPPHLGERET
jgi:hypothetical protein